MIGRKFVTPPLLSPCLCLSNFICKFNTDLHCFSVPLSDFVSLRLFLSVLLKPFFHIIFSSDSRVMLHNASSVSSEPAGNSGHSDDDDDDDVVDLDDSFEASHKSSDPLEDGVLATYEEHEDSVYAVDWSAADPWVFASLSYDGRLVINRVSRHFKYRILL